MIECGCYETTVSSYEAEGYTRREAIDRTIDYYTSMMSRTEVESVYNDWNTERTRFFSGGVA